MNDWAKAEQEIYAAVEHLGRELDAAESAGAGEHITGNLAPLIETVGRYAGIFRDRSDAA